MLLNHSFGWLSMMDSMVGRTEGNCLMRTSSILEFAMVLTQAILLLMISYSKGNLGQVSFLQRKGSKSSETKELTPTLSQRQRRRSCLVIEKMRTEI